MSAQHFEAIKYSLRQSKDGVVVAFVVQPEDVRPELMALPVGARVMIAWSQIGDDEKPAASVSPTHAKAPERPLPPEPPQAPKPRRRFDELSLPQQCALRCDDGRFERFLRDTWEDAIEGDEDVASMVRRILKVKSRGELSTDHRAANIWRELDAKFQRWLTDQEYAESVR